MTKRRPITIVGGGLAGLALGIGLRQRGTEVRIIEAGSYPRHRVCGEFIVGLRAETMNTLGISHCLENGLRLTDSIWYSRNKVVYRQRLPHAAIGISRFRLDERLAKTFLGLGGNLITDQRQSTLPDEPGWIGAHGRRRQGTDWVGLKIHCQSLSLESDLELHIGHRGYVGLSRVENGRVNVCGLFRIRSTDRVPKHQRLLAYLDACGLNQLRARVESGNPDPTSACGVAGLNYQASRNAQQCTLSIGDRTGLIAPFTGNGMAQAFQGAAIAVAPVARFAQGQQSWEETCREANRGQRGAFSIRRRVARAMHPWLLEQRRQSLLAAIAQARLLPFNLLFRLTH